MPSVTGNTEPVNKQGRTAAEQLEWDRVQAGVAAGQRNLEAKMKAGPKFKDAGWEKRYEQARKDASDRGDEFDDEPDYWRVFKDPGPKTGGIKPARYVAGKALTGKQINKMNMQIRQQRAKNEAAENAGREDMSLSRKEQAELAQRVAEFQAWVEQRVGKGAENAENSHRKNPKGVVMSKEEIAGMYGKNEETDNAYRILATGRALTGGMPLKRSFTSEDIEREEMQLRKEFAKTPEGQNFTGSPREAGFPAWEKFFTEKSKYIFRDTGVALKSDGKVLPGKQINKANVALKQQKPRYAKNSHDGDCHCGGTCAECAAENERCQNSGRFLPKGAGNGRGEVHENARRGHRSSFPELEEELNRREVREAAKRAARKLFRRQMTESDNEDFSGNALGGRDSMQPSANEWWESAPQVVVNALGLAAEMEEDERSGIVCRLTANSRHGDELAETLEGCSTDELRWLEARSPTANANYLQVEEFVVNAPEDEPTDYKGNPLPKSQKEYQKKLRAAAKAYKTKMAGEKDPAKRAAHFADYRKEQTDAQGSYKAEQGAEQKVRSAELSAAGKAAGGKPPDALPPPEAAAPATPAAAPATPAAAAPAAAPTAAAPTAPAPTAPAIPAAKPLTAPVEPPDVEPPVKPAGLNRAYPIRRRRVHNEAGSDDYLPLPEPLFAN